MDFRSDLNIQVCKHIYISICYAFENKIPFVCKICKQHVGSNNALTVVTVHNIGKEMMIQGVLFEKNVMKQARTWNILLRTDNEATTTVDSAQVQVAEESIPQPRKTVKRRLLRKKNHIAIEK